MADLCWDRLHALVDEARLPCFRRLIDQGSISSIDVVRQPAAVVWAGMVTGRLPSAHGIYGDLEVRPDGGGVQPCGAASWQTAPVWELLARHKVSTAIFALPGTVPATEWPGLLAFDERFAIAPAYDTLEWPLPPGCIEPPALRNRFRGLRLDPEDLAPEQIGPLPLRPLAYAATVQGLALECASRPDWAFLAAHYPGLGESKEAHRFFDMAIERLLAAAGEGANLIVVSPTGTMVACGPAFPADRLLHGIRTVDVAATILATFGFELVESDGRSFARDTVTPLTRISGTRSPRELPADVPPAGEQAQSAITQVEDQRLRIEVLEAFLVQGAVAAMPLVRSALDRMPDDLDLRLALGHGAVASGDAETCLEIGRCVEGARPDLPWGSLLIGAGLALRGDPEADSYLATAAEKGAGDAAVLVRLGAIALQRGQMARAAELSSAALDLSRTDDTRAQALTGLGLASLDDPATAEKHLRAALGLVYGSAAVHHQLGLLLVRQERWAEALTSLRTAAALAPHSSELRSALRSAKAAFARASVVRR